MASFFDQLIHATNGALIKALELELGRIVCVGENFIFPNINVTSWIGNTPTVAIGHYLQVTDTDFAKAVGVTSTPNLVNKPDIELQRGETGNAESNAHGAKTTHFATHQGGSDMFSNVQNLITNPENYSVLSAFIGELQKDQASRQGLEP